MGMVLCRSTFLTDPKSLILKYYISINVKSKLLSKPFAYRQHVMTRNVQPNLSCLIVLWKDKKKELNFRSREVNQFAVFTQKSIYIFRHTVHNLFNAFLMVFLSNQFQRNSKNARINHIIQIASSASIQLLNT